MMLQPQVNFCCFRSAIPIARFYFGFHTCYTEDRPAMVSSIWLFAGQQKRPNRIQLNIHSKQSWRSRWANSLTVGKIGEMHV